MTANFTVSQAKIYDFERGRRVRMKEELFGHVTTCGLVFTDISISLFLPY
jgi:hypothetical protein